MHPHTKALAKLVALVELPHHSGLCLDFTLEPWRVTSVSCQCSPRVKALRAAIAEAKATLDYDESKP